MTPDKQRICIALRYQAEITPDSSEDELTFKGISEHIDINLQALALFIDVKTVRYTHAG